MRELFLFAKAYSAGGRFKVAGPRKAASFGFYVKVFKEDGTEQTRLAFSCSVSYSFIVLYLKMTSLIAPVEIFETYRQKLEAIFGTSMKPEAKEPNLPLSVVGEHFDAFKETILWLRNYGYSNRKGITIGSNCRVGGQ